jgi:hypothetical protein
MNGRMEKWKIGGMEIWRNGTMETSNDSRIDIWLEKWKDGRMEK